MIDTVAIGLLNELVESDTASFVSPDGVEWKWCLFCKSAVLHEHNSISHDADCLIVRAKEVVAQAEVSPLDAVRQSFSTEAQQRNSIGGT